VSKECSTNFIVGAVIGVFGAYYAHKHKDEIIEKIKELEEFYDTESAEIVKIAKRKLDSLVSSLQEKIENFRDGEMAHESIDAMLEDMKRLKKELAQLKD
jgi:demethoxyubiquinone hydroxylase (CLK1/Coq7/Cat5 family)